MANRETGFEAVRNKILNRPLGQPPLPGAKQIKQEHITPEFNEQNWIHVASFKFEKVGGARSPGGWSSTAPKDHWSRELPNPFGYESFFYVHPKYPDELARLVGAGAVEHVVYIFRRK